MQVKPIYPFRNVRRPIGIIVKLWRGTLDKLPKGALPEAQPPVVVVHPAAGSLKVYSN
jgi:hypothetical protein